MSACRSLYIDLIKKCLTGKIQDPQRGQPPVSLEQCLQLLREAEEMFKPYLARRSHTMDSFLAASAGAASYPPEMLHAYLNRMHRDFTPDTMSDMAVINNLQFCVEQVIADKIPGDLIETGIWKGGLPVLMRAILKAHDVKDRIVWAADSFSGLPQPDPERNLEEAIWFHLFGPLDHLGIPFEYVESVFRKYDLLDEQVKFLKGWFSDTLPNAPIQTLAVMRLDGDWYESTRAALDALYPKLSPGGFVIIDDYGLPFGCRKAVDEYRAMHGIGETLVAVNDWAVFWRKSAA